MEYTKFYTEGFFLSKIKLDALEINYILNLDFKHSPASKYVTWGAVLTKSEVLDSIKDKLIKAIECSEISEWINPVTKVEAHYLEVGEFLPLHDDVNQNCYAQILLWVCDKSDFKGREFMYGTRKNLNVHKPSTGDFMLLNNTNKDLVHAVNMLETPTRIVTLTFELLPYSGINLGSQTSIE